MGNVVKALSNGLVDVNPRGGVKDSLVCLVDLKGSLSFPFWLAPSCHWSTRH